MSRILKGQKPKTTFLDEESSIEVKLISYPDIKQTERMLIDTCFGHSTPEIYDTLNKKEIERALQEVISGGTLPKGLEMTGKFVFLLKNIPLTVTHMVVRHRFFTILQRSTAVECMRHEDYVMPRSFSRDEAYYEKVKQWYLLGKELYCEGVDEKGLSVQNARLFLPKNNCNHMFVGFDIKAFQMAYGQRKDSQEEPIQSNILFEKMKQEIVGLFPYFDKYLQSNCDRGDCLHSKPGKQSNIVFKRNELHQKYLPKDYLKNNPDNVLHDQTRDEMNEGPIIKEEYYEGFKKIK